MNEMTRIAVVPTPSYKARFTTAEFLQMCDMGAFGDWKVELVDGELERMQEPMNNHAMRQAQVVIRLAGCVGEELVRGEIGIILADDTALACDVAVLNRPLIDNRRLIFFDLALVVEIAESTVDRDLGMKRRKYAQAGVPAYWVVDGPRSIVHAHADPVHGQYSDVHTVRFGEPLTMSGTDQTITLS